MFELEKTKTFDHPAWDDRTGSEGVTLLDIADWMHLNDIPPDALIRYAGCGSHAIEFVWEARKGSEREAILRRERDKIAREEARNAELRRQGLIA